MKALRVGLIGTGYMGKCHALAWNAVAPVCGDVPRPQLVYLAEASDALARQKAVALGFQRATGNWRELVASPDIDVVSITTPNQFHAEMAIAALEAGKHLWCEKPMAPTLAEAEAMHDAWRKAGTVAVLGLNYIQNPMVLQMRAMLRAGTIGTVNHIRIEMDEDFMADAEAPFSWKSTGASGYGALDDFGVHPLSLLHTLFGHVTRVFGDMARPYVDRPLPEGGRRAVETHDIATMLFELDNGARGSLQMNRSAWGRKGRISMQVFGDRGSLLFDQERFNEMQLYVADGPPATQGFKTILAGPAHPPYDRFIPAPGHGLGFNDLKILECRELIRAINGEAAHVINFATGLRLEKTVHATADSFARGQWVSIA